MRSTIRKDTQLNKQSQKMSGRTLGHTTAHKTDGWGCIDPYSCEMLHLGFTERYRISQITAFPLNVATGWDLGGNV